MKGRKPKPTALKVLEGNPGKRKLNPSEPKPKVVVPTCPGHVRGVAKREWTRVTRELKALGLVSQIDRAALAAYCIAYGRWVEAERQVRTEGAIVLTDKGNPIQNPALAIANKAMDQMRKLIVEFGMTPSSRSRVAVTPADATDPAKGFLFGDGRSA